MSIDVVTVWHREENLILADRLQHSLRDDVLLSTFTAVDNSVENRGFAKACNLGARQGSAEFIAFLNPDLIVTGDLLAQALALFTAPGVVIAGEGFDKPTSHYQVTWGLLDWVCGACMFTRRSWFESVGGFCEDYVWAFEETDLCRVAESQGLQVRSARLPCEHVQAEDDRTDSAYKVLNTKEGGELFYRRWFGRP